MSRSPRIFVILASDTEDNHPSYVPGWWRYGSDYDSAIPKLRFDWLKHLNHLLECFDVEDLRFKVTWFLRTDPAVGERCLDAMNPLIDRAEAVNDELAIHIHTLHLSAQSKWVQSLQSDACRDIVSASIDIFKTHMGMTPKSTRMGWNFMNNSVMAQLDREGILYDATCIPGMQSQLMYGQRDNFYDWSRAPNIPFHPSYDDYQAAGTMRILEIPLTSYGKRGDQATNLFPKWMRTFSSSRRLTSVGATVSEFPWLSSARGLTLRNHFLIFSAWRNNSGMEALLSSKAYEAQLRGWSYILGYFHPCELLNPLSGKLNPRYLQNLAANLHRINALRATGIEIVPTTLSTFGESYPPICN